MTLCHLPVPHRTISIAALALSACSAPAEDGAPSQQEPIEVEQPAAPAVSDPQALESFAALPPAGRDLVARFGEPFISFETRGERVLISDANREPHKSVVMARRDDVPDGFLLSFAQAPYADLMVTVERAPCLDEFSGETSDHTAWLEDGSPNFRIRGCAYEID